MRNQRRHSLSMDGRPNQLLRVQHSRNLMVFPANTKPLYVKSNDFGSSTNGQKQPEQVEERRRGASQPPPAGIGLTLSNLLLMKIKWAGGKCKRALGRILQQRRKHTRPRRQRTGAIPHQTILICFDFPQAVICGSLGLIRQRREQPPPDFLWLMRTTGTGDLEGLAPPQRSADSDFV